MTFVPLPADAAEATSATAFGAEDATVNTPASAAAPLSVAPASGGVTAALSGGAVLRVGEDFGDRYHIIRVLGAGGMGAVYQAWDKVLETAVAVKVIRPEVAATPQQTEAIEKRFKRELLLARQVTHRNVVRIHDLGALNGVTYITMPYVQGSDLSTILKKEGRLPVARALHITRQIAEGLSAAHEAGVIHRDLKPANVMVDENDHALIMDFGIARSANAGTGPGMTATGGVIGTVEYMAPEQARAEAIDRRCDIYSLGLIVYDMLSGGRHGSQTTAVAGLVARMQHAPPLLRTIDPTIPEWLEGMVNKCLQPDPAARYQTLKELLADLDRAQGPAPTSAAGVTAPTPATVITPSPSAHVWRWIAAAVLFAIVGTIAWTQRDRFVSTQNATVQPTGPAVRLAIVPFRNDSGDPSLDALGVNISQLLGGLLGESSHIRTVRPERAYQVLQDLRIAQNATLRPVEIASIASLTSATRLIWGWYSRFGSQVRIEATLQDVEQDRQVAFTVLAPNETALLTAISELADRIRPELARGAPDILNELKSTSWKPSTSSFEALQLYNEGVQLTQQGAHQEAAKKFQEATEKDADFALALSALARSSATLGYEADAVRYSREAMTLAAALPPQEKYRIEANHHQITNDGEKAIEAYKNLATAAPNDTMIRFDLGVLLEGRGLLDEAREQFAKVVELDPTFIQGLLFLGRAEIRRGQPQTSLDPLNRALSLAIQRDNVEAHADILQAIGIAYARLNRPQEALKQYQHSLEIKQKIGNKRGMAASHVQIADVQRRLGELRAAEQSYRAAEKLRRDIGDQSGLALTLIDIASLYSNQYGRPKDALPLLQEALTIVRDRGNVSLEARALNNTGAVHMELGNLSDAQTYFERALEVYAKGDSPQEHADTLHNLGQTFARMGRYDQALQRYSKALEVRRAAGDRRSEAIEQFATGTIFDVQGRYGAAVTAKQTALETFRGLKLRDALFAETLSGTAESLALSGRTADAASLLQEARTVATELQNPNLVTEALRLEADRLYYAGDLGGAATVAQQAGASAGRASSRDLLLLTQFTLTRAAAATQPTEAHAAKFAELARNADAQGLRTLAVDASVARAETLLRLRQYREGVQEADRAIGRADQLGLRMHVAKGHFVKASALRAQGSTAARRDYAMTVRLLEEIRREEGNQQVLSRADLKAIYAEALDRSKSS